MRVVLDTSVLVAAVRSPSGASRQLLLAALNRRYAIAVSVALVLEYEAVLTQEQHLAVSGLTVEKMGGLLDAIVAVANHVRLSFLWRRMLRDPDDDMVLEVAVNAGVDGIVTLNERDFTDLPAHFPIDILSPGEAFARLKRP